MGAAVRVVSLHKFVYESFGLLETKPVISLYRRFAGHGGDLVGYRGALGPAALKSHIVKGLKEHIPGVHAEELQRAGFGNAPSLKLYRGRGCPNCFGTGYRGRTGVFEILEFDGRVRRMVAEKKSRLEIEEALRDREKGHVTLWENAQRLVLEGVTTAQEMTRIINEEDA